MPDGWQKQDYFISRSPIEYRWVYMQGGVVLGYVEPAAYTHPDAPWPWLAKARGGLDSHAWDEDEGKDMVDAYLVERELLGEAPRYGGHPG